MNPKVRPCIHTALSLFSLVLFSLPTCAQIPGPKDTFAAAGLSAKEVQEIIAAVEISAFDTPDSWTTELRVKRVDLTGAPGLVVRGTKLLCGATGNCQTWIFQQSQGKWLSLFASEEAPVIESLSLGPGTTNGIKDLTVTANSGAEETQRVAYQFDGHEYRKK